MPTQTVRPTVDLWVDEAFPSKTHEAQARLRLNGGGGSDDRQAFIHFPRPFPRGVTILQATLTLYFAVDWDGTQTITAKRITDSWSEETTWSTRPSVTATHAASTVVSGAVKDEFVELDVTQQMQDALSANKWRGVRLELSTDDFRSVHSSEYPVASLRPALTIQWTEPPDPPELKKPTGGRVISATQPLLIWSEADTETEEEQVSSRVEVSTSTDFSSPEYDSGKVTNNEEQWDLSFTAYSPLTDGDIRYWRVMVWNEDDVASEWSEIESFEYESQGTLSIVSPGATVEELTPVIEWDISGRDQLYRQVTLFRVKANGDLVRLFRWDKKKTDVMTVDVPPDLIHTGKNYRVRVTVWDTFERQSLPGYPAWVRAEQDFTYERAGGPDSPTGLTATPITNSPAVLLEWEAASAPDFFCLTVDGEEVASRIDPDDVHVTGTSYALVYWRAKPRVETLYEMEAVEDVAGFLDHSDGNSTATATTAPRGIWLIDLVDGLAVEIDGKESIDQALGEGGATFDLIGRRSPVRITDSIRGYEGTVRGVLLGKEARDDFLELKGRVKRLRLVLGDASIPVILGPAAVGPTPLGVDEVFSVSFEFAQVAEFTFEVLGIDQD